MKTITSVIKIVGKEEHAGLDIFSQAVYEKCVEFGIIKTRTGNDITIDIVNRTIRSVLSLIKLGKGKWANWSYRYGFQFIKLYDNASIDILTVNKSTLEGFDYIETPEIKVLVRPTKEGVEAKEFFKSFTTLTEAKDFIENEDIATEVFISAGNMLIPLEKKELYK